MKISKVEGIVLTALFALMIACIYQHLNWPLIIKFETELEWWQNRQLAAIGAFLTLPSYVIYGFGNGGSAKWWAVNFAWCGTLLATILACARALSSAGDSERT